LVDFAIAHCLMYVSVWHNSQLIPLTLKTHSLYSI